MKSEVELWESVVKRFWKRVQKTDSCWLWVGLTDKKGYGLLSVKNGDKYRNAAAHRVSWAINRGPIPEGIYVLHDCPGGVDIHGCVNPDHLFLGDHQDNMKDAARKFQMAVGERHPCHKLTQGKVLEIQHLLASGMVQEDIANLIGVCESTVHRINKGKTWKYLIGVGQENHQVAVRFYPRGEKCSHAKLTDLQVVEIIRLASLGLTHEKIAAQFGVSRSHVGGIVSRKKRKFNNA